jgi:hypothetical protein
MTRRCVTCAGSPSAGIRPPGWGLGLGRFGCSRSAGTLWGQVETIPGEAWQPDIAIRWALAAISKADYRRTVLTLFRELHPKCITSVERLKEDYGSGAV